MPQRIDGHRRRARMLRRPAVLVAAFATVMAGASTAAASDWFDVLTSPDHDAVAVGIADLFALPDLGAYGDLVVTDDGGVHEVPNAKAATAETGLDAPDVASASSGSDWRARVHRHRQGDRHVHLLDRGRSHGCGRFSLGVTPASRPRRSPGSPRGWPRYRRGLVAVVRTAAPDRGSRGGSDGDVVRALHPRRFATTSSRSPACPTAASTTSTTEVDGVPATVFATDDQIFAAVVWSKDGTVTAVAGTLGTSEILSVARNLR